MGSLPQLKPGAPFGQFVVRRATEKRRYLRSIGSYKQFVPGKDPVNDECDDLYLERLLRDIKCEDTRRSEKQRLLDIRKRMLDRVERAEKPRPNTEKDEGKKTKTKKKKKKKGEESACSMHVFYNE
jgi:hypothetical protein